MRAIEQVALEKEPTPLVLAIDEIDFVRSLPFDTDDFFTGIRECHNRRAHQPALKRLTFCLIGSATPNDLIQNVHITPFNVGRRVTITDFTTQEAQPLADGLTAAGKDGKTLLAQALYWTSGHPYLTQRLCGAAAQTPEIVGVGDIDQLAKRLFLSRQASATEDVNLAFVRDRLLKSDLNKDRLFGLYQAVHEEKRAVADDPRDPYCNALRLSGIVAERDGYLFVRNRIYHELFTREWAQEQMPGIEAAQRRREVRRARWQVASIAGCIIAVMGGLVYNANLQYQRANTNAHKLQLEIVEAACPELVQTAIGAAPSEVSTDIRTKGGIPAGNVRWRSGSFEARNHFGWYPVCAVMVSASESRDVVKAEFTASISVPSHSISCCSSDVSPERNCCSTSA